MAGIRTVTSLRCKREEIRRAIIAYEEKLNQAKADLSHVSAAVAIFEGSGEGGAPRPCVDTDRLFARTEPMELATAALLGKGPMDTRCSLPLDSAHGENGDSVVIDEFQRTSNGPLQRLP